MSDRQADIERISETLANIYEARERYRNEMRSLTRDLVSTAAAVGIELVGELLSPPRDRPPRERSRRWFDGQWGARRQEPAPSSSKVSVTPTMTLEGPSGGVATGAFVVENVLAEPIEAKLQWTEFSAEGASPLRPALEFTPGELRLAPGEQIVVEVSTALGETLEAGRTYQGEIFVAELPGTRLRVDLRRRPAPGVVAPQAEAGVREQADAGPEQPLASAPCADVEDET